MARPLIRVNHQNRELSFANAFVTIGGRLGVDVLLDDVMVADRHCVIEHDGAFRVRDAGSVTGTWVDGEAATTSAELRDGAKLVIGTTEITATIRKDDGTDVLELTVAPQPFRWWQPAKKGAFDNDPDALVRDEVGFGRFPLLHAANRVAIVAGVVVFVAATFVAAVMQPLADPGPLQPSHALVLASDATTNAPAPANSARCAELAAAQGCDVCHATGAGATEAKCLQCHSLPGELGAAGTWRHPYLVDGKLGNLAAVQSGQQFCVRCHTDHVGATTFKPGTRELIGACEICHAAGEPNADRAAVRAQLLERAPIAVPPPVPTAYDDENFPHAAHLAKQIDCEVCHRVDPSLRADRARGVPDDPLRHDFAVVAYETCRGCHVPGFDADGLTAEQRERWRARDHQWTVTWHGTDDGGSHCATCHAAAERGGARVHGPERNAVARGSFTAEQYAAERARYTSPARLHEQQFAQHAGDRACVDCHVDGKITAPRAPSARTFWHGLHTGPGSLQPADSAAAARVSTDAAAGCTLCHGELANATALQPADRGAYHWPDDAAAQRPCAQCHREGEGQPLALRAEPVPIGPERTRAAAEFPHGVHLASPSYGKAGALANGCFACHAFTAPTGERTFTAVPTTLPDAADCTRCHAGHDNVGGGACRQCHPAERGRSNAFVVSARVAEPARPQRPWPLPNGFSHLSPGHSTPDLKCASCHDGLGLDAAKTLADVRVPDESAPACRDCHLQRQFHWR